MKKKYIIIATSLLVLGSILFGGAMTVLKWNFNSSPSRVASKAYFLSPDVNVTRMRLISSLSSNLPCSPIRKKAT